jgi:tetratricopeptide (TPR) repeat protein
VLFTLGRDDEALGAYRKAMELKPDFSHYEGYLKMAVVYADENKLPLAQASLQQYAQHASALYRAYLPIFEGQFKIIRGDLDGGLASYGAAVTNLAKAGQDAAAGEALGLYATLAILVNKVAEGLSFASQQKLHDEQWPALSLLQTVHGDTGAAERSLEQYAASRPWIRPVAITQMRTENQISAALFRKDGNAAMALLAGQPQSFNMRPAHGRAQYLIKNYAEAESDFRRDLVIERILANFNRMRVRQPLIAMGAHYYLGQIYAVQGKRDQAIDEYQQFLSHFENSRSTLPQVETARAALKQLMQ